MVNMRITLNGLKFLRVVRSPLRCFVSFLFRFSNQIQTRFQNYDFYLFPMKVLGAIRIVSAADTYRRSFHVLSLSESDSYCLTHAITHAISQFTLSFFSEIPYFTKNRCG